MNSFVTRTPLEITFHAPKGTYASDTLSLLQRVRTAMLAALQNENNPRVSLATLDNSEYLKEIRNHVTEKRVQKIDRIIVLGIGGSILGTQALYQALPHQSASEICTLDTLDSVQITKVLAETETLLKEKKRVVLYVVSKSGTTLETAAQSSLFISLLRKHIKSYEKNISVITDMHSPLWMEAQRKGFSCLKIPLSQGGRFSVTSAVTLAPLGTAGFDMDSFIQGAKDMRERCLSIQVEKNPAMTSALLHFEHIKKEKTITNLFMFAPLLESVGKWCRQLIAESLGKNKKGITPTVSIGSTDLHSMAQLYLDGPRDTLHTFVTLIRPEKDISLPTTFFPRLAIKPREKSMHALLSKIAKGTMSTFTKKKIPFIHARLPSCNPYYLGQFFQWKMMEVMYLGALLKINAFNQPAVELYKKEVYSLLNA